MKTMSSKLLIAAIAVLSFTAAAQAGAYSKAVQQYCRADYKKFCGDYGLETTGLRSCMDRNGKKLSKSCVKALIRDGHVSQAQVNRRKN